MNVITFQVPLPPIGLRRNRQTANHGYRASLVREYQEQVWCAGNEAFLEARTAVAGGGVDVSRGRFSAVNAERIGMPWLRARVHYEWRSTHQVDEDNAISSMKAALDVIKATGPRPLRILEDDANAVISATWCKVNRRADECVVVTITEVK